LARRHRTRRRSLRFYPVAWFHCLSPGSETDSAFSEGRGAWRAAHGACGDGVEHHNGADEDERHQDTEQPPGHEGQHPGDKQHNGADTNDAKDARAAEGR
jgi:hypothetical protein